MIQRSHEVYTNGRRRQQRESAMRSRQILRTVCEFRRLAQHFIAG